MKFQDTKDGGALFPSEIEAQQLRQAVVLAVVNVSKTVVFAVVFGGLFGGSAALVFTLITGVS